MTDSEYISPADAARIKGVNVMTVLRAIAAGKFARVISLGEAQGTRYGIHRDDVIAWEPRSYNRRREAK